MGRAIADLVAVTEGFSIAAAVAREGAGFTSLAGALAAVDADVVVEVTGAGAGAPPAGAPAAPRGPGGGGGTRRDAEARAALERAAADVAVVDAPNFSLGIAVLRRLALMAARRLPDWDRALLDRHHRAKRDAPSGTAAMMARDLEGLDIASFRQGGIVGEHTVYLAGGEEELVLTHRAFDRRAFARGALAAARFAAGAPPGLYGMADVLELGPDP